MIPGCVDMADMKSEEYAKKYEEGPDAVLTVFANAEMGRNLALAFVYCLVVNSCLAYRDQLLTPAGADFMTVFSLVATAGLTTSLAASVQHATCVSQSHRHASSSRCFTR